MEKTKDTQFGFSNEEKKIMLEIARKSLVHYFKNGKRPGYDDTALPDSLSMRCGIFISLYKDKELRGCIGTMKSDKPLYELVQKYTLLAARSDPRFGSVELDELPLITIEISVLSEMKHIDSPDMIEPGRDGIYIKYKDKSGTFLPQVARKTGWNTQELLGHCARDKAGIGWNGWQNAEIYTYGAEVFSENDFKSSS